MSTLVTVLLLPLLIGFTGATCCSKSTNTCCVTFTETAASTWTLSNGGTKTTLSGASAGKPGTQTYEVLIDGVWAEGATATAIEVAAKSFPDSYASLKDKLSIPGLPSSYPNIKPPEVWADKVGVLSVNDNFKVGLTD